MKHLGVFSFCCSLCFAYPLLAQADTSKNTAESAPINTNATKINQGNLILPNQTLTPEILYNYLLGEIAGSEGKLNIANQAYNELLEETMDPRIAKRATKIAIAAQDIRSATKAAIIWQEGDPKSTEVQHILDQITSQKDQRLIQIQDELSRVLREHPKNLSQNILGINSALSSIPDKAMVRIIVEHVIQPYLQYPEAHFTRAYAAFNADNLPSALHAIDHALQLRPNWGLAILLKVEILNHNDEPDVAADVLEHYLQTHTQNLQASILYIRTLINLGRVEDAQKEVRKSADIFKKTADQTYTLAILAANLEQNALATKLLKQLFNEPDIDQDTLRLLLGQIDEKQNNFLKAITWYEQIKSGEMLFNAKIHIISCLSQLQHYEKALTKLEKLTPKNDQEKKQVILLESAIYNQQEDYAKAFRIIEQGLHTYPEEPEFLYDSAMLAERLNKPKVLENRLRKLIALDPENAQAYNALGYSFASRNIRLDEAASLVEKAYELSPDDPFILDSMGWISYLRHDAESALSYLEEAYDILPSPDVAEHLAQVLISLQRKEEAIQLLQEALKNHPNNQDLIESLKQYQHKP